MSQVSYGSITITDLLDTATYIYYSTSNSRTTDSTNINKWHISPQSEDIYIGIYSGPSISGGQPNPITSDILTDTNNFIISQYVGETGKRGGLILGITTEPSLYTTIVGTFTPSYRIAKNTVLTQSGSSDIIIGDILLYSYYHYPVGYIDNTYVYLGTRKNIRGESGATGIGIIEIVPLYYAKENNTAPNKPPTAVSITTTSGGQWTKGVPELTTTYPYLFTCEQIHYDSTSIGVNGYNWTDPVLDKFAENYNSFLVTDAGWKSSYEQKITNLTTTLGTNTDGTTKTGDIIHRASDIEQDLNGFKTTVSSTYATKTYVNSGKIWYAECSTAAGTAIKDATITPATSDFNLQAGTVVYVKFLNTNSSAVENIKLRINSSDSTKAKNIKYRYNSQLSNIPDIEYLKANQTYQFYYDGTYWIVEIAYNTDTYDRVRYVNQIGAITAITAEHLICGSSLGYENLAAGVSFDLSYPILYTPSAITANATSTDTYLMAPLINIRTTYGADIPGFGVNKKVYLKGSVSGNTFTIANLDDEENAIPWITAIEPDELDSNDEYYYILLGTFANNATSINEYIYFISSNVLYKFVNGKFQIVNSDFISTINDNLTLLTSQYESSLEQLDNRIQSKVSYTEYIEAMEGDNGIIQQLQSQITQNATSVEIALSSQNIITDITNTFKFEADGLKIDRNDSIIYSKQGSDYYKFIDKASATDVFTITQDGTSGLQANVTGQIGIGSGTVSDYTEQWAIRKGEFIQNINGITGFNGYNLDIVWVGGN